MKNLRFFLSIITLQSLFINGATARTCSDYLNPEVSQEKEEHDLLKSWKVYTLTNPALEDSTKAYSKLSTHYFQKLEANLSSKHSMLNLLEQENLKRLGNKRIDDELKKIADELYVRFEESKKHMDSNPDFYHAEVLALKDILNSMEAYFDELIDEIIKTKLIYKIYQ